MRRNILGATASSFSLSPSSPEWGIKWKLSLTNATHTCCHFCLQSKYSKDLQFFCDVYLLKCQFTVFHLPLNGICLQIEVDPNSNGNPFPAEVSSRQRAKCHFQTFSLSPEPPSKPSLISFLKLIISTEGNVTTPLSCYKKPDFHSSSILGELDYCSLAKCHLQTFSLSPHQPKQILTI